MQTIVSLVSAGLGAALIPESMRNLGRAGVAYGRLRERGPLTELVIAWRENETSPVLARFLESTRAARAKLRHRWLPRC